jgi:predicted transcriptional regulator
MNSEMGVLPQKLDTSERAFIGSPNPVRFPNFVRTFLLRNEEMGYNTLKIRVLGALEQRGWVNTAMLSYFSGLRPVRSVSSYMEHLRSMRLVRRRWARSEKGRTLALYSISKRGRERLSWLKKNRVAE